MLKIDLHTHTIASGHAFNTIYEMAKAASEKGVKILGITEHGPDVFGSAKEVYFACLDRVPKRLFGIRLLFGAELNIMNEKGKVDLSERTLKKLDFASGFHFHINNNPVSGKKKIKMETMIAAFDNPYVSVVVHSYLSSHGMEVDIEELAQAACDYKKLLEISTVHFEYGAEKILEPKEERLEKLRKMIKVVKKNKQKILLGSDAHVVSEIGVDSGFRKYMRKLGLTGDDIANNDIKYLRKFIKNI